MSPSDSAASAADPAAEAGQPPAVNGAANVPRKKQPAIEQPGKSMGLLDHLGELRRRMIYAAIAVMVGFFVAYQFAEPLFYWLMKPVLDAMPEGVQLQYLSPPDAFFVYMKTAFVASLIVMSPFVFYQIWAFVAPGLYEEERKYVIPLAGVTGVFFIAGAAFCYFQVFPLAFRFFMSFTSEHIKAAFTMTDTFSFCIKLLLAFGLIFEMPIVAFALARLGVVTPPMLRKARKYAILVIFIVAAILTPPDVVSQLLMAFPMLVLYEVSIYVVVAFGKKKPASDEAKDGAGKTSPASEDGTDDADDPYNARHDQ